MTDPTRGLRWENFLRRLDRTRTPHSVWPVLQPARGPQLYLLVRDALLPPEPERRTLPVDVANLGLERAKIQVEVFDSSGKKVGKNLPDRPPYIPPGACKSFHLRPTLAQWRTLAGGGHLLVSPGSLPEPYRTFRFHRNPLEEPSTLEWPFPVPYAARLTLPSSANPIRLNLNPDATAGDTESLSFPVPPGQHVGGALRIALPYGEVHYQFSSGEGTPTTTTEAAHSVAPDFLRREWKFSNPTPFAVSGRLRAEPRERIAVDPEWLDVPAGTERSIRLTLSQSWLAAAPQHGETVEVRIESTEENKPAGAKTILRVALRPQPLEGPVLKAVGPLPAVLEAQENDGQWLVALPLSNPGTEPARIFLRFENGETSDPVTLPPLPPGESGEPASFGINKGIAAMAGEAGLTAGFDSDQDVVWDRDLIAHRFRMTFPVKDDLLAEEGDLRWEIEWRGRSHVQARLVFQHQKKRRRAVTLRQVDVTLNGDPLGDSDHTPKVVRPGEKRELVTESLRVRPWSRISLRAEVQLLSDGLTERREAIAVVQREGGSGKRPLFSWVPKAWSKSLSLVLLLATMSLGSIWWIQSVVADREEILEQGQPTPIPSPDVVESPVQPPFVGETPAETPIPPKPPPQKPPPKKPTRRLATGTLSVHAEPWAEVWVDGNKLGDTPFMDEISAGKHQVVLRYYDQKFTQTVTIRAGRVHPLTHNW